MSKRVDSGSRDVPGQGSSQRDDVGGQADGEAEAGIAKDMLQTGRTSYREEDWEEGPARVMPQPEQPPLPRRRSLDGASLNEVSRGYNEMLAELMCETHDFAMAYFESARAIDDRVAARERKLSVAIRLATLAGQLVAAADRHHKEWPEVLI